MILSSCMAFVHGTQAGTYQLGHTLEHVDSHRQRKQSKTCGGHMRVVKVVGMTKIVGTQHVRRVVERPSNCWYLLQRHERQIEVEHVIEI